MSMKSARGKLLETLSITLDGFPTSGPERGIPKDWRSHKHPAWYFDIGPNTQEDAFLQAVDNTGEDFAPILLVVVHVDDLPEAYKSNGQALLDDYLLDIADAINAKLQLDTGDRVYENDGDKGFRAELSEMIFDWHREEPLGAGRFVIRITQFR